ncbi:MAG: hypothetical protein ABJN34_16980 [Litoreibacter sp.]|uniref:hypothetical protein n=1 Tax=Litoreibacter sp. TaxID=1969459 RepID=UPI003296932B
MRFILICAALASFPHTPLWAQSFTCSIKPSGGYSGVTPRRMVLNFDTATRQVAISDDVAAKVGLSGHAGTLKRVVGDELLFNWKIKGVPNKLKPSNDRASLGRKVFYSGRLNQRTGAIRVTGNFATIGSGASSGQNMRGRGQCQPS